MERIVDSELDNIISDMRMGYIMLRLGIEILKHSFPSVDNSEQLYKLLTV